MKIYLLIILSLVGFSDKYYGSLEYLSIISTNESSKDDKKLGNGIGTTFIYDDLFYQKLNSGLGFSYIFDEQNNPQGYSSNIYLFEIINNYELFSFQKIDLNIYAGLNTGILFNSSQFDTAHVPPPTITRPNTDNDKSSGVGVNFGFSVGMNYQVFSRLLLKLEISSNLSTNDRINPWLDNQGDGFWKSNIGVSYRLSKNVDSLEAYDEYYLRIGETKIVDIKFKKNSVAFTKSSYFALNSILKTLLENPSWMMEIQGHMSSIGNRDLNNTLSSRRPDKIKEWLILNGIEEERLVTKGFGKDVPIYDRKDILNRMKNERIEIVRIIKK